MEQTVSDSPCLWKQCLKCHIFDSICCRLWGLMAHEGGLISNMYKAGEKEFERQAENDSP